MIYLLVDLKIVLALHWLSILLIKIKADLKEALIKISSRGAYQNLKSCGGTKPSRGAKPKKWGMKFKGLHLEYLLIIFLKQYVSCKFSFHLFL